MKQKNVTMLRNFKTGISYLWWGLSLGCQDVQYNDTWHNDTQHNIKTWHLMLCWVWFMLCLTLKLIAQCCHALCLYTDGHILMMSQECQCDIIYMTSPVVSWWSHTNVIVIACDIICHGHFCRMTFSRMTLSRMALFWLTLSDWHYTPWHYQNEIMMNDIITMTF